MKTKIILLLAVFFSLISFAQNGINYKAVIKDNNGNVIANQTIDVRFTILQGVTNIYQETHSPATDDNGIVSVNIGEGTPVSGTFSTIDWASDLHFLNVQIDTGNGLTDMGTNEFKAVPYALNVTGLEALNEGNGIGHRIIGRNLNNLGNIGLNAVDLSQSPNTSSTYGATGTNSVAMNRQTTAQGQNATAMGLDTKAYGNTSTTMGFNSIANGYDSVAMGAYTVADAVQSVALGRFNIGGGHSQIWNPVEPLFEIGNGINNANRNNAMTVLKNGTITAPTLTNTLINNAGNKALITKEYADANYVPKTKEIMIPAASFVSSEHPFTFFISNGVASAANGEAIYAPVVLPVGAIITEISAYVIDDDSVFVYDLDYSLKNKNLSTNVESTFFTFSTIGNPNTDIVFTSTIPIQIISNHSYYIRIDPLPNHAWSGNGVKGVKIIYTE